MQPTESSTNTRIHPETHMGPAALKVANLARSVAFYTEVIGLQSLGTDAAGRAIMGVDVPVLLLEEVPNGKRPPTRATGLYHAAILLPTRQALAVKVKQLVDRNVQFGYSDHLVSEAFYLDDVDGNGLELYADRPRSAWKWDGSTVRMANASIDFESLFAETGDADLSNTAMPAGTKIGHMHLKIGDIGKGRAFYHEVLGFDVTADWNGALFMSAGGYHHHLGMNVWHSEGSSAPPEPVTGLRFITIVVPDADERQRIAQQLASAGISYEQSESTLVTRDPWGIEIRVISESAP